MSRPLEGSVETLLVCSYCNRPLVVDSVLGMVISPHVTLFDRSICLGCLGRVMVQLEFNLEEARRTQPISVN